MAVVMVMFWSFLIVEWVIVELGLLVFTQVFVVIMKSVFLRVVQWLVIISFTLVIDVIYVKFKLFPPELLILDFMQNFIIEALQTYDESVQAFPNFSLIIEVLPLVYVPFVIHEVISIRECYQVLIGVI